MDYLSLLLALSCVLWKQNIMLSKAEIVISLMLVAEEEEKAKSEVIYYNASLSQQFRKLYRSTLGDAY